MLPCHACLIKCHSSNGLSSAVIMAGFEAAETLAAGVFAANSYLILPLNCKRLKLCLVQALFRFCASHLRIWGCLKEQSSHLSHVCCLILAVSHMFIILLYWFIWRLPLYIVHRCRTSPGMWQRRSKKWAWHYLQEVEGFMMVIPALGWWWKMLSASCPNSLFQF